jgi:hypothetical protein
MYKKVRIELSKLFVEKRLAILSRSILIALGTKLEAYGFKLISMGSIYTVIADTADFAS